ncbi:MAG TPA: hemin-degrading factor [Alphaproteobacteria bacterium]|nr:hemin-degrading factor [Alphaproteobacteria bacterium]
MSAQVKLRTDNENQLLVKFNQLKAENPSIRPKDAADKLGVTEAELVAARIDGKTIFRLENKFQEILKRIGAAGEVMALTRNDACVHERKGVYNNVSFMAEGRMNMGLVVNPDIDLRLFMNSWAFAFAVEEQTARGPKKSIQFYMNDGVATHKIYVTGNSNIEEFDKIISEFRAEDQSAQITVAAKQPKKPDLADSEVDYKGFEQALSQLKDTHDFYILLHKFNIGRVQALRLVSEEYAYKVDNNSSRKTLELARDKGCEIMVFVGNKGNIQIHTGAVSKLVEHGEYFNVLDPKFNLHLNEKLISKTFVTRKPTEDGIVTALEVFDKDNELIVTFFGKRKPGIPELTLWREIISELPKIAK